MSKLLINLIRFYQGYISPYKGFSCAYRMATGCASCSNAGIRILRRYGIISGLPVLRRRLYLCGVAHRRYFRTPVRAPLPQRGDCVPCDCDVADCDSGKDKCNCLDCADVCSCDWPDRDKRKRKNEDKIHLPQRKRRNKR